MEEFLNQLEAIIEAFSAIIIPCITCTSSLLVGGLVGLIAYLSQLTKLNKDREWQLDDQKREMQKNRLNTIGEHLDGISSLLYQANYFYDQNLSTPKPELATAAQKYMDKLYRENSKLSFRPDILIDDDFATLYRDLMKATNKFDIDGQYHNNQIYDINQAYEATVKRFDELFKKLYN